MPGRAPGPMPAVYRDDTGGVYSSALRVEDDAERQE